MSAILDATPEEPLRPSPLPPPPLAPLPIEVFDVMRDVDRHAGRSRVRSTVLAMTPVDGEEPLLPGPLRRPDGAFWGIQSGNGLTLAMRAATFSSALAARRDAVELLAQASRFEIVPVRADAGGLCSYWVLLNGRVVLVGGQAWRQSDKSTARALLHVLGRLPRS